MLLDVIGIGAVNAKLYLRVQLAEIANMFGEKGHAYGFSTADGDLTHQFCLRVL